jgi:hypothetical protein
MLACQGIYIFMVTTCADMAYSNLLPLASKRLEYAISALREQRAMSDSDRHITGGASVTLNLFLGITYIVESRGPILNKVAHKMRSGVKKRPLTTYCFPFSRFEG